MWGSGKWGLSQRKGETIEKRVGGSNGECVGTIWSTFCISLLQAWQLQGPHSRAHKVGVAQTEHSYHQRWEAESWEETA